MLKVLGIKLVEALIPKRAANLASYTFPAGESVANM